MAGRIRSLRPDILSDAHNAQLSDGAWRLLTGAKMLADDAGRAPASPAYLDGAIFWAKPRGEPEVEQMLHELVAARQIALYAVEGVRYLEIVGWQDRKHVNHQRIDKPGPTRFPAQLEGSTNVPGVLHESSTTNPGGIGIREGEGDLELERERDAGEASADPAPLALTGESEQPKRTRKRPAIALPADWQPRPEDTKLQGEPLKRELERFRNYAAGEDWRKVDWDATWRNWQLSAMERAPPRPAQHRGAIGSATPRTDHPEANRLKPCSEVF